ncbi:iron-containing redox enzyme family protein [Streptomyces sp. NBC_00102]|uniref:iron-containing redox enzyme family protein n=1 Tax=Streptomyces sp. NBC_00102 TaxID=2975652 RepID=UPI002256C013|nr:iron-containing redox enzyme family protein [Streptomyces sp. NBC_00102]MCX5398685.1 iron-containing redox enzyme family protein [Streptomyces sp. NBC_00102]
MLRTRLALAAPTLRSACAALWHPEGLRPRYLRYLAAMHGLVRASVPLMELAARRCAEAPGDPLARPLGRYLATHAEEERDHDAWLVEDLAVAGGDPAALLAAQPPAVVAELVGAQYYWIEHHHPVVLLGYILTLEHHAPSPLLARRLARDTGLPAAAFRTVHEHAALDGGHAADLDALLDELPLTRAQLTAVAVGALHAADGITRLFARLTAPGGQ